MKRSVSITRRLILALTGMMVAFWLLATGLGMYVMRDEFGEIFDSTLQETAERLMPLIVDDIGPQQLDPAPASGIAPVRLPKSREYLTYQVRDRTGSVLLRSDDAPVEPFDAPLSIGFHDTLKHRIFSEPSTDGSIIVQVADSFHNRREAEREGGTALLIPLILLIPASIGVIWFAVRRALAPIDRLQQQIAAKNGGNLAALDGDELPDELEPIAGSVNLLLGRLKFALDAEREFTANSAHELRTPIAGALAQTQRLVAELPEGADRRRAHQIERSLTGLGRLAEKLLQLSRAEAGIGVTGRDVDLVPVLAMVVEDFSRDSRFLDRINFDVKPERTLISNVDVDAFAIALRNLIENALIHGDEEKNIVVAVANRTVRVVNAGATLSDAEMSGLKRRFRRGNTSAAGSGLGLAIADRVVTQMGATLELLSPPDGSDEGFEARVTFHPL